MALIDELKSQTDEIVHRLWTRRDGQVVPETGDLQLGNHCVDLDATFLYSDLAESTSLATFNPRVAAEVFKSYLMGTTRIIRAFHR